MLHALRLAGFAALLLISGCSSTPTEPTADERRADVLAQAGIGAISRKEYSTALRNLMEARKYAPKRASIWSDLGVAYAGKGEGARAEECWKRALQLDPNHSDASLNLGILYMNRKSYAESERVLKEAASHITYQNLDQVAYQLAMLYLKQGKPLLAEQQLRIAVKENSAYCAAWMRLGILQKERGDYTEAAQSLKGSVMGACYKNPRAHYEIATLFMKAQDYRQAKSKLLEIIQLFPSSEWASRSEATLNMIR